MKGALWFAAALVMSLGFGCKDKVTPASETPPGTTAPAPAPAPVAVAEPPLDPSTIPVPEDFEDEAEKSISSKNLNEELDKLEREIQAK